MAGFVLLAVVRIVATYHVFATTADEPAHLACGLQYVAQHIYRYEAQHPPLTRAMIALLPYLSGTRPRGQPHFQLEGWDLIVYQHHPEQTVTLMRLGNLPFFVLGCLVVFYWARRYFGAASGVVATGLFTLIPTVLAHAGLATTDMGLTACLGAAFLALLVWAEEPSMKHGAILGFLLALALLSKFTALVFFPVGACMARVFYRAAGGGGTGGRPQPAKPRAASLAIAAGVCLFAVWGAYFFSFDKVPVWNVSLPAWEYFDGIRDALDHNASGHFSYLLGQPRSHGCWYYFPVALGVKTPLAFLALLAVGIGVCWRHRRHVAYLMPLAFALGILLPAMSAGVNIGVRHVLPVYLAFSVIAALGLVQLARLSSRRAWAGAAALGLVLWLAATGALHHPDYIPYFNELVPGQPDRVLCDSDYDWGQDTKRLAARLKQLGATQLNYGYAGQTGNSLFLEAYPGLPPITGIRPLHPAEGWTAVCPTIDHATQYGLEYRDPNTKPWYTYFPVRERVGTIDLLYLPSGSLHGRN